jgi:hypothetical protein
MGKEQKTAAKQQAIPLFCQSPNDRQSRISAKKRAVRR